MTGEFDRETAMTALGQALPYIRLYRGKLFVLKIGGASMEAASLRRLVEQIGVLSELGIRIVLVHGGGSQATVLADRLGVPTRMIDGRRVTSSEVLEVTVMALNGTVSTALLAAGRAGGLPVIGVSSRRHLEEVFLGVISSASASGNGAVDTSDASLIERLRQVRAR